MPEKSTRKSTRLILSAAQKKSLERAARAAGVDATQLIHRALARMIEDYPLDLPQRGESQQIVSVILTVRTDGQHISIQRAESTPLTYFRRLYRADLHAAAYLIGEGWTESFFAAQQSDIEHDLALEAMAE